VPAGKVPASAGHNRTKPLDTIQYLGHNDHTLTTRGTATMKYANAVGYSDVTPYEVIRNVTDKTIEIREMQAERDKSVEMEFHVGGFSAHCSNQHKQKWFITSDETAPVVRIRLRKNGTWADKWGQKFDLNDTPVKFYDYNF